MDGVVFDVIRWEEVCRVAGEPYIDLKKARLEE